MLERFRDPPAQYRLAPFWVWREIPDPSEVDRQVREMHAKGIGGFFIDGRLEGQSDESGEELVRLTQRACAAAERLALHVYQYDDLPTLDEFPPMLDTKLRSSSAHAEGRVRTLAKVPHSAGWTLSPAELKRAIDRQACLGANFFCPDAFHYSLAGLSLSGARPSQFYQATYWRYYKHFADYAARLGYVLSQGKHKAQAALLRPGAHGDPLQRETIEWLKAYCECLLAEHIDFDIVDEETLACATCADERLSIADEQYELLILPPAGAVALRTAEKIKAFTDEGGKLIGTMLLPAEDSTGDRHAEVREAFAEVFDLQADGTRVHFLDIDRISDLPATLSQALHASTKREVSIRRDSAECPDIACTHLTTSAFDVFFLANHSDVAREVRISIRCDRAPHMLNLETGDITALPNCTQQGNRTVLLHRFEGCGSLAIAFGDEPAFAVTAPIVEVGQEIALADEWEFIPEQANCLTLPAWAFNILIQPDRELYEYTTSFEADHIPESLVLALEQTEGFGADAGLTALVNDVETPPCETWIVDVNWKAIDIAPLVRSGRNVVRVLVEREGWTGEPQSSPAKGRLMGSFSLGEDGATLLAPAETIRNGSWTDQGYPCYSGTATYRQTVMIPHFARGQRVIIRAENPADIVEFVVNGAIAGVRLWPPFEVDATSLVKPGPNQIELRVTNSLANMLLSDATPSGLIGGAVAFLA